MRRKSSHYFEQDDGGEGLWAVSYSDLLMVLMSFFIVFFNMNDKKDMTSIQKILLQMKDKSEVVFRDGKTGAVVDPSEAIKGPEKYFTGFGKESAGRSPASIGETSALNMSDLKSKYAVNIAEKEIVIDLPANIFSIGMYELDEKTMKDFDEILAVISPYRSEINLIVVGHSDKLPINPSTKIVNNNLILSTIRATKGVEYLIKKGFEPTWISAQGVGEHNRNTRSLSVRIMARN